MTETTPSQELDKHLCGALKRQPEYEGETCKRPAGWGTIHPGTGKCKLHGGSTRTHAHFAEVETAKMAVNLYGGRRDVHPARALLELVQSKAREVEYWRWRVAQIPEEDLTFGLTVVKTGGMDSGSTSEAKPHIALVMLRQAEQDLASYASASLKAGVDAALVEVAQVQAAALIRVLERLTSDPRVTVAGSVHEVIADAMEGLEQS